MPGLCWDFLNRKEGSKMSKCFKCQHKWQLGYEWGGRLFSNYRQGVFISIGSVVSILTVAREQFDPSVVSALSLEASCLQVCCLSRLQDKVSKELSLYVT